MLISTKPNVVKYSTSGSVVLTGKAEDVKKKLEVNPKTKIPQILFTIYQHVFNSIYMLSSNLNTPYPPPDLLHPMAEKIQILSNNTANQAPAEKTEAPPAAAPVAPAQPQTQPSAETQAQPAATATPTAPVQPQAPAQPAATAAPAASSQPETAPK